MPKTARTLPADWAAFVYNLVMVGLWLAVVRRAPHAPWLAAAHGAGLALPWLFARLEARPRSGWYLLRELYPLLLVAAFWIELDLVRPALDLVGIDAQVSALDQFLFGLHLHEVWLPRMSAVWISEVMHLFYYLYYPSIYVPVIALAIMGRETAIRDMTFRLLVTYLACYVVYIAFPVDGPHVLMQHTQGPHTQGFFYRLVEAAQRVGESRGCSFPSSHVAGATTIAYLAWRWLPRWVAVVLTVEAIGVLLSTAYTQHHYFVDSVAGLAWGLILNLALAGPLWRLAGGGRATGVPAPNPG